MQKFEIQLHLQHVKEAKTQAVAANREFLNRVDKVMTRLIHEAAAQRMSINEVANLSGFKAAQIKARMKAMDLNPSTGKVLLSRQAASVLELNAEILGISPTEIDLMSPLAYLPAGPALKPEVSSVTDLDEKPFPETPLVHTIKYGEWQEEELDTVGCGLDLIDAPVLLCDDITQITCPECRAVIGVAPLAETAVTPA